MQISISEFKTNVGRFIGMAENQDIYITKNGRQVAKIVSTKRDRAEDMKSLFGIAKLSAEYDDPEYDPHYKKLRDERAGI